MMTMMIRHIVFWKQDDRRKKEKLMGEIDKLLTELDEQQQELNDKK